MFPGESSGIIKYDIDGNLIDIQAKFLEAGLEKNVVCKRKEDGTRAIVKHIDDNTIHMQSMDKKTAYTPSIVEFKASWEIVMDKDELKDYGVIANWDEHLADSNESIALARSVAEVHMALMYGQCYIDKVHPTPCFDIRTKPDKKVFLEEDAKAQPHPSPAIKT